MKKNKKTSTTKNKKKLEFLFWALRLILRKFERDLLLQEI